MRGLGLWIVLVVLLVGAFELTPLDVALQDRFFDFASQRWLVDGRAPLGRLLFYDGPKALLIALAVGVIAVIVGPASWRRALGARGWFTSRPRLVSALLLTASVPAAVGVLKNVSGVFCPAELVRYGGRAPYRRPFSTEVCETGKGHCWPAGHASGGFALFVLMLVARSRSRRRQTLMLAIAVGWVMGLYQMLKGAHFMSHTLVTILLALIVTALGEAITRLLDSEGVDSAKFGGVSTK